MTTACGQLATEGQVVRTFRYAQSMETKMGNTVDLDITESNDATAEGLRELHLWVEHNADRLPKLVNYFAGISVYALTEHEVLALTEMMKSPTLTMTGNTVCLTQTFTGNVKISVHMSISLLMAPSLGALRYKCGLIDE